MDAGALEYGADRTTGDNTGTGSGRTQHDNACGGLALHRVRNGPAMRGTRKKDFLASSTPLAIAAGTSLALP